MMDGCTPGDPLFHLNGCPMLDLGYSIGCPRCARLRAENEALHTENDRLRAEQDRHRRIANQMVGALRIDIPESDSTEMLLTHAYHRVLELQSLISLLNKVGGSDVRQANQL